MRFYQFFIILVFFSLFIPVSAITQENDIDEEEILEEDYYQEEESEYQPKHFLSGEFHTATPISITRKDFKESSFGGQLSYFQQLNTSIPVFLGMVFSFGQYDHASLEYYDFEEYDEFLFEKTTNFYLMSFGPRIRYFPGWRFWKLELFSEMGLDVRHSMGGTSIVNLDLEEGASMVQFVKGDWQIGYDVTGGALIDIGGTAEGAFGIFKMTYAGGPNTFFYIPKDDGEISGFEEPIERYNRRSIPYRFLNISLGITGYF